ncbi:unnamed protein product [Leuciscus chuanchicus]
MAHFNHGESSSLTPRDTQGAEARNDGSCSLVNGLMGFAGLVAGCREASIPECSCDTGPDPHRIRISPASGSWDRCASGSDCTQRPGEPDGPRKHAYAPV